MPLWRVSSTRRDSERLPEAAEWVNGTRIVHVPAGPPVPLPKEELLPHMEAFTAHVLKLCRRRRRTYDVIHANFWMSGLVAAELKRELGIPFVMTFHALGRVRRLHQKGADRFPDSRFAIEDRIVAEADQVIAECPQDEEDLVRLYNADPAKIVVIPCGFDPTELWPISKPLARVTLGLMPDEPVILHLGRLVPRKGVDNVIRAAKVNVRYHLAYIGWLAQTRNFLAGDRLTYADLAAAANLSAIDYLGDVPWHEDEAAKAWYARVKSRPSFRPLLSEWLAGVPASRTYVDLDF